MFLKHITLEGYLPFSHCGNKHVEFDCETPGIAILGGNGSGKSSLLAAISPFPAVRTSYAKNGKIEMTWEHNGSIYEISSDFSNTTAPNHFVKDGTELNIGGTGETQKDLVEEHFGLYPYVWDIVSGNMHICSMVKSARKQLFSSCYPSDLTFLLDYHKKVCSQVRAYGNQLKLLQSREGSYRASLMDPSELNRLSQQRDVYLKVVDRIDKVNLLLENEVQQLRQHPAMKHEYHPDDLDGITYRFRVLREAYVAEFLDINRNREFGETINTEGLNVCFARLNAELRHLEGEKERVGSSLQELRDELNKFSNIKYASTDDKRTALLNELGLVKAEMETLQAEEPWKDKPIIPFDKVLDVVDLEHDIIDMIGHLHSYAGSLLTGEQIDKLKNEIFVARAGIGTYTREKLDLQSQLEKCAERLQKLEKNSYPQDCARACALRATVEGSIRETRMRSDQIKEHLAFIEEHSKASAEVIQKNEKILQEISPALPVIKCLVETLQENYLTEIALKDDPIIDCLNSHGSEIVNRIRIGVEYSKKYHRFKNLQDRFEQITHTLSMMKTIEHAQMSTEIIEHIIKDREQKIEAGLQKLTDIEGECNKLSAEMDRIDDINGIIHNIEELIKRAEICINIKLIRTRIQFDQDMIQEHSYFKNELTTKLREIEAVLTDQKRLSDILNTETLPQLERIRQEKTKWEAVELALSPTKGLPCIYLVRFINRLISRANAFIKEVWNHDMELVYLNEDEDLDFTLPVLQYKSTVVKDCSMCSKGEQAMIDLAMMLAICVERNYVNVYGCKLDEVDAPLTDSHRTKVTGLIGRLLEEDVLKQLFLVSHFAVQTGIANCGNVVLSSEGIVVPDSVVQAVIY